MQTIYYYTLLFSSGGELMELPIKLYKGATFYYNHSDYVVIEAPTENEYGICERF